MRGVLRSLKNWTAEGNAGAVSHIGRRVESCLSAAGHDARQRQPLEPEQVGELLALLGGFQEPGDDLPDAPVILRLVAPTTTIGHVP